MSEPKTPIADTWKTAVADSFSSTQLSPSVKLGDLFSQRHAQAFADAAVTVAVELRKFERVAQMTFGRQRIEK